ncbi:hypothetical protein [Lacticaseibacillus rhamnosus]|jgi:hypothetical protein|uniref:hypothetical protein n=2 Tax=Lacticaseibacillus rhamnosus TaxID=47715 RepID=UPI001CDA7D9A|nr:hypothetical protein [Lacticaseibacillus rhamnosus]MDH5103807.1 hypothetical protein [Lacticaseibacillus rhamnosus]WND13465.1 hypothetical protein RI131_09665 [Lacticaseibacillus rhamnosus]WNX15748.1 hypothetical protein RWA20_09745 [Lacticaseibacillus rhamnosus]
MNERTGDMAQSLCIDGFLEDYPALVNPDFHDPSPDALIDIVLIAAEQTTAGEPFSIWVDGKCPRDHESKEFSFNIDTEYRQPAIKYIGVK